MQDTPDAGGNELQVLLRAIATMSCEVAEQLEQNSSGIGEDLVKVGALNKDLMVRLQAFDRMHQELDVISNVVQHCSDLMSKANVGTDEVETIVAEITLAQFRHRLQRVLANSGSAINGAGAMLEEQVF
ncbi:MAG TPA: hypothetical protein VMC05_00490 [Xanthobacteraceae bacterium]|nr:hypothetical protein [Xanthobacteraceae bacterium]